MSKQDKEFEVEQRECGRCGEETEHMDLGFIPTAILDGSWNDSWAKTYMCSECGAGDVEDLTDESLSKAHKKYCRAMVEAGLETKETIEKRTGIELE